MNNAPSLRLIYMGTATFAVPALQALAKSHHEVVAVYTQPARPAGRGMNARPSPINLAATELSLPVMSPVTLKEKNQASLLANFEVDLAVVAAYGLILPQAILDVPRLGCINLHGSCLPRWRGAAPIQRAILAGDRDTGITVIQMEAGLDTGPILAMTRMPIEDETTTQMLHDRLAELAAKMVVPVVDRLALGNIEATPQPSEGAIYAPKIEKSEGRLDWSKPAITLDRKVRALNPWPGCWTELDGLRLRILEGQSDTKASAGTSQPGTVLDENLAIACGEGTFHITKLQRAGGKPMSTSDFLRGHSIPPGTTLGAQCLATN